MALLWNDSQMQQACDNIAATFIDALSFLPTTTQGTGIINDIKSEYNRIRVINDQVVTGVLMPAYLSEMQRSNIGAIPLGRLVGWYQNLAYAQVIRNGPYPIMDALDVMANQMNSNNNGLADWANASNSYLHQYFADCFNSFVADVTAGIYIRRYGIGIPEPIPSGNIFVAASADTIKSIRATGTNTLVLDPGTFTLAALGPSQQGFTIPGGGTLEAYAKTAISGTGYTVQITYAPINAGSGSTATITVPASVTLNTVIPISGITTPVGSVTAASITSGSATIGDQIGLRLLPIRTVVQ
jgi:hypothetical protein